MKSRVFSTKASRLIPNSYSKNNQHAKVRVICIRMIFFLPGQLVLCMTKFRTLIVIACNVSLSVSLVSEFGSSSASMMFEPDMPQKAKSGMEQSQPLMVYRAFILHSLHFTFSSFTFIYFRVLSKRINL